MSNNTSKFVTSVFNASFLASSIAMPLSAIAGNPFSAIDLESGYQVASRDAESKSGGKEAKGDAEGKCGEGKCGGEK